MRTKTENRIVITDGEHNIGTIIPVRFLYGKKIRSFPGTIVTRTPLTLSFSDGYVLLVTSTEVGPFHGPFTFHDHDLRKRSSIMNDINGPRTTKKQRGTTTPLRFPDIVSSKTKHELPPDLPSVVQPDNPVRIIEWSNNQEIGEHDDSETDIEELQDGAETDDRHPVVQQLVMVDDPATIELIVPQNLYISREPQPKLFINRIP